MNGCIRCCDTAGDCVTQCRHVRCGGYVLQQQCVRVKEVPPTPWVIHLTTAPRDLLALTAVEFVQGAAGGVEEKEHPLPPALILLASACTCTGWWFH
jgi:hypothetical protein